MPVPRPQRPALVCFALSLATSACWMNVPPPNAPTAPQPQIASGAQPLPPPTVVGTEPAPLPPPPQSVATAAPTSPPAEAPPAPAEAPPPPPSQDAPPRESEPAAALGVAMTPVEMAARDPGARHMLGARISGKRYLVEAIIGGLIGGATAELLFNATCSSNSDCTGSLWLSAFADFAVTPAAVWGLGTAMSGEGKLSTTYYGLVIGVVPFAVQGSPNDSPQTTISRIQTELAISVALTPFATALAYEVSSTVQAVAWFRAHNARMAFAPSRGGGFATVGLSF